MPEPNKEVAVPASEEPGKETPASVEPKEEPKVESKVLDIPVRKTPWSNREERKEFFTSKKKEDTQVEPDENEPVQYTREQLNDLIQSGVKQALTPIESSLKERSDVEDVRSFLADPNHERFKKYESEALRYMKDPAYSNVSLSVLFKGLAFDEAMSEGTTKAIKADDKTQRQRAPGSATRPVAGNTAERIKSASPKEFDEMRKRVMSGEKLE